MNPDRDAREGRPATAREDAVAAVGERIDEARRAAGAGRVREAFEGLYALLDTLREGAPGRALEVLADLRRIVPSDELTPADQAWLSNAEGLILEGLGRRDAARAAFERMLEIGETIADRAAVSTARQNLGILAQRGGDVDAARRYHTLAVQEKLEIGDYRAVTQILINLASLALQTNDLSGAEDILARVDAILARAQGGDLRATFHANRGLLAARRGDMAEAGLQYRRALRHARRTEKAAMEVFCLQELGNVALAQGNLRAAIGWYRGALAAAEKLGSPLSLAGALRCLATALHRAGRDTEAAVHLERARLVAVEADDRRGWAQATADLGALALMAKEPGRAKTLLERALDVFRESGDRPWQAQTLRNMAALGQVTGDTAGAIELIERALELVPADDHTTRASLLRQAGEAWRKGGRHFDWAAAYYNSALREQKTIADPDQRARQAAQYGAALSQSEAPADAVPFFTLALAHYEATEDEHSAFQARNDRGNALTRLRRYEEARQDFDACLSLAANREDRAMELLAVMNKGEMARRENNVDEALRLQRHAHTLARALNDRRSEIMVLGNLGAALEDEGRWDEARAAYTSALDVARASRLPSGEAMATGGLGNCDVKAGRYARAARRYRRAAGLWSKDGDRRHEIEAIAALVDTLAALGRDGEMEEQAGRLVDLAQDIGAAGVASYALSRSAGRYLDRQQGNQAVDLYAAAIAVTLAVALGDGGDVVADKALSDRLLPSLVDVVTGVRGHPQFDNGPFFDRIVASLTDRFGPHFNWVRRTLEHVRATPVDVNKLGKGTDE